MDKIAFYGTHSYDRKMFQEINAKFGFEFWKVYVRTHIPPAYEGMDALLHDFNGITKKVTTVNLGMIDVSSTLVRELIKKESNPMPFINENAWELIKEKNLYK